MCYRVEVKAGIEDIAKRFKAKFEATDVFQFNQEINGFAHDVHPIITNSDPHLIASDYHWGLVPPWCKDDAIKKNTLNARIETLAEKPAFRDSINNRCLVIATAFYEWRWNDEKGKNKQKFIIHSAENEIFAFAGLFSTWRSPITGQLKNTFSIITTEANEKMQYIHNNKKRMPIMLHKQDENAWLRNEIQLQDLAYPKYDVPILAFTAI